MVKRLGPGRVGLAEVAHPHTPWGAVWTWCWSGLHSEEQNAVAIAECGSRLLQLPTTVCCCCRPRHQLPLPTVSCSSVDACRHARDHTSSCRLCATAADGMVSGVDAARVGTAGTAHRAARARRVTWVWCRASPDPAPQDSSGSGVESRGGVWCRGLGGTACTLLGRAATTRTGAAGLYPRAGQTPCFKHNQ
jgi:hypothetical protein